MPRKADTAPAEHFSVTAQSARMGLSEQPISSPTEPAPASQRLLGALSLHIVEVTDLPPRHSLLHHRWTPFVVVSFGSETHKSRIGASEASDPSTARIGSEVPLLPVDKSEENWDIGFSVWDAEEVGTNAQVGMDAVVSIAELVDRDVLERRKEGAEYDEVDQSGSLAVNAVAPGTRFPVLQEKRLEVAMPPIVDANLDVVKQPTIGLIVKVGFIPRITLVRNLLLYLLHNLRNHDSQHAPDEPTQVTASDAILLAHQNLGLPSTTNLFANRDQVSLDEFAAAWDDACSFQPSGVPGGLHSDDASKPATCISCGKPFPAPDPASLLPYVAQQRDHLLLCASRSPVERAAETTTEKRYLTEAEAAKGIYLKTAGSLLSRLGFGTYKIGSVEGHILVRNRRTGLLEEEYIPAYVRLGIQLLYRNRVSQSAVETARVEAILKRASIAHGARYDDPKSRSEIPAYVRTYSINVDEISKPLTEYQTMNEFFCRRLKPGARKLEDGDPNGVPSVADCRLSCYTSVDAAGRIWIKGTGFSISRLLDDEAMGKEFEGGTVVIHRLAPQDYHRWHNPVSGTILKFVRIRKPGLYYTVNPMAIRSPVDVFGDNVRDVCYVDTGRPDVGVVAVVAVGAMMVGSIVWNVEEGQRVKAFDEMGTFKFGGSTVIVLFRRGTVKLDADLVESSGRALESVVQVGDRIGSMVVGEKGNDSREIELGILASEPDRSTVPATADANTTDSIPWSWIGAGLVVVCLVLGL